MLGVVAVVPFIHDHRSEPKPPRGASISQTAPSSIKPSQHAIASYSVPLTDPKYLAIPTIGINNTPVLKLGRLKDGSIATPGNIYQYNKVDMSQVLAPVNAGKPGLNIMTCTGQVIKDTSEFNERLVVFTSLVNS